MAPTPLRACLERIVGRGLARLRPRSHAADAPSEPVTVAVGDDGRRLVSWEFEVTDGKAVFEHDFPDAVVHHYAPASLNESVFLYEGAFRLEDDRPFVGDVRYRWYPRPGVEARGSRDTRPVDLVSMFGEQDPGVWVDATVLDIDLGDAGRLPTQPSAPSAPPSRRGHWMSTSVEQTLGDPDDLEQVTFLVPNGWADGGRGVCDPNNLRHIWYGRTEAAGGGWSVILDRVSAMGAEAWRALKESGGNQFTHVGCLTATDGGPFTARQAFDALDRVRVGLNIALGRRTSCCLPVGWRAGRPVWTRWRSAPVDPFASKSHWLDDTIVATQVSDVVSRVLDLDAPGWEALRPAVAYYMAANVDVDVELSVAIPVSALQLLAYYRFVTVLGEYSNTKWHGLDTEAQLRLLLSDITADLSVRSHFVHLTDVHNRLAQNAPPRDALGVVVKMRNVVTHPTRDKPTKFSIYEWAEAGMHARYWLCLALLHLVGYHGQVAEALGPSARFTGQLRTPPWAKP